MVWSLATPTKLIQACPLFFLGHIYKTIQYFKISTVIVWTLPHLCLQPHPPMTSLRRWTHFLANSCTRSTNFSRGGHLLLSYSIKPNPLQEEGLGSRFRVYILSSVTERWSKFFRGSPYFASSRGGGTNFGGVHFYHDRCRWRAIYAILKQNPYNFTTDPVSTCFEWS